MRIKRIMVKKYKNLIDFDCEFSDSNISAFIGNNGAGKSNILELITSVFSVAKNKANSNPNGTVFFPEILGCEIEYEYEGIEYKLCYNKLDIGIYLHSKKLTQKEMLQALPEAIMIYYAGETKRQYASVKDTFDERYNNILKKASGADSPGFKFLDYYSTNDLDLLLLTAAVYKGEYYKNLLRYINCTDISTKIDLFLNDPKEKGGNADTYWGARGFVKSFLDELRKYVTSTQDLDVSYIMSFKDAGLWKKTSENEAALFAKLNALKNSGYFYGFNIILTRNDGNKFLYDYLSEGEKQLALIYLLTSFTANNNCLYLFDEFDAYLHLNWQRSISKMLNDVDVNGHIIFTTHSPGTISQMKSDNLYIMKKGQVIYPESETYNRALDEIMLEQMDVSMRPQEIEELYDKFKQSVAERNKEQAEHWMYALADILDETDPLFTKMRINLRRI